MKALVVTDDLVVSRKINRSKTGLYITPKDKIKLLRETQDAHCFVLYDYFATTHLNCSDQIDDAFIAAQFEWSLRKVADTRRVLIKLGYLTFDHALRASDNVKIKIVYVGKLYRLMIEGGLPRNILNHPALDKLLKKFPLDDPSLSKLAKLDMLGDMEKYYLANPNEFKP